MLEHFLSKTRNGLARDSLVDSYQYTITFYLHYFWQIDQSFTEKSFAVSNYQKLQTSFKKICRYFKIFSYLINVLLLQKGIVTLSTSLAHRPNHI